jgi:hypothetical protein
MINLGTGALPIVAENGIFTALDATPRDGPL